jgi:hypothetical protein
MKVTFLLSVICCLLIVGCDSEKPELHFKGEVSFFTYRAYDGSHRAISTVDIKTLHAIIDPKSKAGYGPDSRLTLDVGDVWTKVVLTQKDKRFESLVRTDLILEFRPK